MCCNGDLFADVRLQRGDDGLRIGELKRTHFAARHPAHKPVSRLPQPCGFLEGCRCRAYRERPAYCRQFECAVIRQLKAARISAASAVKTIRKAKRLAAAAKALLEQLGNTDTHRPLAARFRQAARELVERSRRDRGGVPTNREETQLFGELTEAMHEFNWFVSQKLHPGDGA